jgi:hypothetical protein
MSPRQQFALSNPIDAKDLGAAERFAKTITVEGRRFGTILTVDKIEKQFFWHACVSVLDAAFKPIPRTNLDGAELMLAHGVLRMLLIDIGIPSVDKIIFDEKTIQIRRPLNPARRENDGVITITRHQRVA